MLLFTIPLHAAASEDLPEEADAVIAGEESVIEDSSDGSELTGDAAEPAGNAQAEDAGEPMQTVQNEEEGNYIQPGQDEEPDGSALTEQIDQDGTVPAETEQSSFSDSPEEAEDVSAPETSGLCGEELFWEYSEGILSITGRGEMYDYRYAEEAVPGWSVFSDLVEEIHIGEGVTLLDLDAFTGFTALKVISFNGSADAWSSVVLTGEEVLPEEDIFSLTEIRFAEQEETAGETVETEDGIEDEIEGPDQDSEVGQSEENEAQDPAEGQPEGDEAQDPADVQPEEGEEQEPAFEQHEDTENQDPAEENSELVPRIGNAIKLSVRM